MEETLWLHIETVRQLSPLVHNITNYVVMNNTANALLAIGASPIMAHAMDEINDIGNICQSLVVNIGTLSEPWINAMLLAAEQAQANGKPWVLDPVGAGASALRNKTLVSLLKFRPTVIRGNASEILALAASNRSNTKGVDSTAASFEALDAGRWLHAQYGSIVCISGETDIIIGDDLIGRVYSGHSMMTKVTGLGCSATAVIGAFIAIIENKFQATLSATALFSCCGELAAKSAAGPGSLQVQLLDQLYNINEKTFLSTLKCSLQQ